MLLVGHATRLLAYLNGEPKVYEATIAFGSETDTDDVTGVVTRSADLPETSRVLGAIPSLTGTLQQTPPAYSAKQVGGRRAYEAARRGEALDLAPVTVTVHQWNVRSLTETHVDAVITCGGGTYIRALARDLGRLSGSAAHLATLRRTRSGGFDVREAVTLEELRGASVAIRPLLTAVAHLPTVGLSESEVLHVRQGRSVAAAETDAVHSAALVDAAGALVAIAERAGPAWQPRVVMPDA